MVCEKRVLRQESRVGSRFVSFSFRKRNVVHQRSSIVRGFEKDANHGERAERVSGRERGGGRVRGERGGRAEPGVGDAATRIARRVAERGSARLASGGSPRAASGGGSNRAPSPRISKTRKTRSPSASRASRFRRGAGRSTLGAIASRARAREKRDVRRERRARISFVGISIEGVVRTAATFMSQPSLSSPSVKLAYPRVASCASSSSAICSRLFWFFQSPSPPPLPRRCACPLPRPASPYMFPLERPPVFPLNAGWPPGAPIARVRGRSRAKPKPSSSAHPRPAPREPRRSPCARSPRL